jgi:uncharacterized integral membrane protein
MGEAPKDTGMTPGRDATPSGPAAGKHRNLTPKQITMGVAAVVVVLFALLNFQNVTMHWIVGTTRTPLIIVVVGCLVIGLGIGYLVGRRTEKSHGEAARKDR